MEELLLLEFEVDPELKHQHEDTKERARKHNANIAAKMNALKQMGIEPASLYKNVGKMEVEAQRCIIIAIYLLRVFCWSGKG